jgi:putative transposase
MGIYGTILPGAARLARIPIELSRQARQRLKWMDWYEVHGRNARLTCRHFGISPDTFYRWKKRYEPMYPQSLENRNSRPRRVRQPETPKEVVERIRELRQKYPKWSKYKIAEILKRDYGITISPSTVGRNIKRLKDRRILIETIIPKHSRARILRKRTRELRKPKDYEIRVPGDLVQVDTLTIAVGCNVYRKQFTARDIISKWDVVEAYGRATSVTAKRFLYTLKKRCPFSIKAVQVDGGSEFMAEFERECKDQGIRLFVLPPRSPNLNGCVERANKTHGEEFYEVNEIPLELEAHNRMLRQWEDIYNTYRPHQALKYKTPLEFILKWQERRA